METLDDTYCKLQDQVEIIDYKKAEAICSLMKYFKYFRAQIQTFHHFIALLIMPKIRLYKSIRPCLGIRYRAHSHDAHL